jgi:acyl-CoA synthetase (AMP-forming)/AMP-acid ligase II
MVQDHRVTRAYLAPPMVLGLAGAEDVSGYDLSSLRFGICGAAPLDVDVTERAEKRLGCPIRQGYGMTEASPGTHLVPDDEFTTAPAGSVGRLVPSTEARLVDPETGAESAEGEPGELWVRGPQVMAGYLDNPGATTETIVDGAWLRTGDIVRVDADGIFWIVDRLKELIKYKGYQVAPAELESVLLTHPEVLDVAVVGIPHAEGGEAPKAFVVAERPIDPDLLMAWLAERVAPYKKVRSVEFVAEIPKSPSGKILRRLLR